MKSDAFVLAANRIRLEKDQMRKRIIALRSSLQPELHSRYSQAVCERAERLLSAFPFSKDALVLAYMPFGQELDMMPLVESFWRDGVTVAAPVSLSAPKRLEWRTITGPGDLEPGVWGIREPSRSCPLVEDFAKAELLLLPGVAFDTGCGRLGYGGGYYDRFLAGLIIGEAAEGGADSESVGMEDEPGAECGSSVRANAEAWLEGALPPAPDFNPSAGPFKLALAFDLQIVERVPLGRYDQYADAVLTENRFFAQKRL